MSDAQEIVLMIGYTVMNWAVPMFFMISGVLLLDRYRHIGFGKCLIQYARRILLALFCFGVPFAALEIIATTKSISFRGLWNSILAVFFGESWGHLWYLYVLIGVYLVLPVLKAFTDKCSKNELWTFIGILFLFNLFIPLIEKCLRVSIAFTLPVSGYSIFYVLLGKALYDETPRFLKDRRICTCIIGIVVLLEIVINLLLYPNAGDYLGYGGPITAIMCIAVFALFRNIAVSEKKSTTLWKVDRLCFGAYLIHPVFTNVVYKFLRITPFSLGSFYPAGIVLFWIVFVICGFGCSWILNKIGFIRKYIL